MSDTEDMGAGGRERSDDLLAEARRLGFATNSPLSARIDAALADAIGDDDRGEIGRLFVVRALAAQGHGDATGQAADSAAAVSHLVADGDVTGAASAAAMAAVFTDQCGDIADAMDHAVQALVLLDDVDVRDQHSVRALLGLTGLFLRLSSFDIAVELGQRAFSMAKDLVGIPIDTVAFTIGYVAAEATHLSGDEPDRRRHFDQVARSAASWLSESGGDAVARSMLAPGLFAELDLAHGRFPRRDQLDAAECHYDDTVPDLVAWHLLLRGSAAHVVGDHVAAVDHLTRAVPGLRASADNHCLVRAMRHLAAAHAASGDHERAYEVASELAEQTRSWQLQQVGRLATQVVHRADLERSQRMLQETAARLADDIDLDATTGVRSRHWLERRLDELSAADADGVVLMFDLDHFKVVNDTHGHHVGDQVLRRFGQVAQAALGGEADLARFGGEEFVALRHRADADDAGRHLGRAGGEVLAERVRRAVESHDWTNIAPGLDLTVSCGVAAGSLSDARTMLVTADDALLDAKRRGRNRVTSAATAPAAGS